MDSHTCIVMLRALADEKRWRIAQALVVKPSTVGELAEKLHISPYNASKHVKILREAGIVSAQKQGTSVVCRVADEFRNRLPQADATLDLGCCTFHFDQVKVSQDHV